jgi:hypothetical protein
MPQGISTEIEGGYALIDFIDPSKKGRALSKLLALGPVDTDTSGRRKRYRVPEGNAREAGLIDEPRAAAPRKAVPKTQPVIERAVVPAPADKPTKAPAKKRPAKKAPAKTAPPRQESDGLQDQTA